MRKTILLISFITVALAAAAQEDTVWKDNNLVGHFDEHYCVQKSHKKVKQGAYQLYYFSKLIALGRYEQGRRSGVWDFYRNGKVEQVYDYTNNKVLKNYPLKSMVTYQINNTSPGDSITAPVKIGGFMSGFKLMQAYTDYLNNLTGMNGSVQVDNLISLDENGQMTGWVVNVKHAEGMRTFKLSFKDVPAEARIFLPAKVNNKAVPCVIDFHENGGVTTRRTQVIRVGATYIKP